MFRCSGTTGCRFRGRPTLLLDCSTLRLAHRSRRLARSARPLAPPTLGTVL